MQEHKSWHLRTKKWGELTSHVQNTSLVQQLKKAPPLLLFVSLQADWQAAEYDGAKCCFQIFHQQPHSESWTNGFCAGEHIRGSWPVKNKVVSSVEEASTQTRGDDLVWIKNISTFWEVKLTKFGRDQSFKLVSCLLSRPVSHLQSRPRSDPFI